MNVITADGHYMNIPQDLVNESAFLMSMNDCCEPGLIPLTTVKRETLEKLIYYNSNKDVIMNETQEMLFQLVMAADFLQMDVLLDRGCRTVADYLKGKSPKEIRSILGISETGHELL
jgi:hypothetical protein